MDNYKKYNNILVEPYKAVYFNLPKVASTTMMSYLVEVLGMEKKAKYESGFGLHLLDNYPFPYATYEELDTKYKHFLKFTIVRNPWDRLVSCYKNKFNPEHPRIRQGKVMAPFVPYGEAFWAHMTFKDFVNSVCHISDWEAERHFKSQYIELCNSGGRINMTFIAKLAHFKADMEIIQQHTGLPNLPFAQHKKSHRNPYTTFYDGELAEKVAKRYATDIALFHYQFGEQKSVDIHFLKDKPEWNISPISSKNYLISSARNNELSNTSSKNLQKRRKIIFYKDQSAILSEKSALITQELHELEIERTNEEEKRLQYQSSVEELAHQLDKQADELAQISAKIDALKSSYFWKLTMPIRWLIQKMITT